MTIALAGSDVRADASSPVMVTVFVGLLRGGADLGERGRREGLGVAACLVLGSQQAPREPPKGAFIQGSSGTSVLSGANTFTGNITLVNGEPFIHAHITLANIEFGAVGGHFKEGTVGATLEVFVTRLNTEIHRCPDEAVGLNLMDLT